MKGIEINRENIIAANETDNERDGQNKRKVLLLNGQQKNPTSLCFSYRKVSLIGDI